MSVDVSCWKLWAVGRKLWDPSQPPTTICHLNLGYIRTWLLKAWSMDEQNRTQLGACKTYRPVRPVPALVDQNLHSYHKIPKWLTCMHSQVWEALKQTSGSLSVLTGWAASASPETCYKCRLSNLLNLAFLLSESPGWSAPTLKLGKRGSRVGQSWLSVLAPPLTRCYKLSEFQFFQQ